MILSFSFYCILILVAFFSYGFIMDLGVRQFFVYPSRVTLVNDGFFPQNHLGVIILLSFFLNLPFLKHLHMILLVLTYVQNIYLSVRLH